MTRSHPITRSTKPIPHRAPIRKRRAKPRRTTALRCPAYIAWLHKQRCEHCGALNPDPYHGPASGRGVKGPDNEALPLCRTVHQFVDGQARLPNREWGRKAAMDWLGWFDSFGLGWNERAAWWWAKFCQETKRDLMTGQKVRRT